MMKSILTVFIVLLSSLSFSQENDEFISWETAKVNNKIPLTLTLKELENVYKRKADSIAAPLPDQVCGTEDEKNAKMVYHRGVRYEMDNGVMNFREIDFSVRKNMFFQHKDDWFDSTTTLKNFARVYPVAASQAEEEEDEEDGPWSIVTLFPKEKDADCLWLFYFKKGKLRKIRCEFSCE
jgi:hypothetical protein